MKTVFVVSALKGGYARTFDTRKAALDYISGAFEKMTYESNDSFVVIETKAKR